MGDVNRYGREKRGTGGIIDLGREEDRKLGTGGQSVGWGGIDRFGSWRHDKAGVMRGEGGAGAQGGGG